MRVDFLPSPGLLSQGIQIRTLMAKAISAVEISATFGGGKASQAKSLDLFLDACKTAIAGFIEAVAPTVTSRIIPANRASRIDILCSEGLDRKFVPAPAAFTLASPSNTITRVEVDGPYIRLHVATPYVLGNTPTVAYTQPGATSNLRDESGNLLASFGATAITNNVP